MRILNNGLANSTSTPVQVYAIDRNTKTIVVGGNFAGASVTVQYSSDKNTWTDVVNAVNLKEKTTGSMYSYTGWMRVVIDGGVMSQIPTQEPLVWHNSASYDKNTIVNIDGSYFVCTKTHIDGTFPNWDFYEPCDYVPEQITNKNATNIFVDLI